MKTISKLTRISLFLFLSAFSVSEHSAWAANQPPVLSPIGNKVIKAGIELRFQVTASDPDPGDPIRLSAANLPAGAAFVDQGSGIGEFAWTPALSAPGIYSKIKFTATTFPSPTRGSTISDAEAIAITVLEATPPVAILDTFDGDTISDFSWDVDGSVVYERAVSEEEAFDGRKSMKVAYQKNSFAPYSFFAFHLAAGKNNLSSFEELRVRVRNAEGGPVSLLVKIENGAGASWEATKTVNVNDVWAELVYDLTNAPFVLNQVQNILWLVNPGDTVSTGTFYLDHIMLVSTAPAVPVTPLAPVLSGPVSASGQFTLGWTDVSASGGALYRLLESGSSTFNNPRTYYTTKLDQLLRAPAPAGFWHYRVEALSGYESFPHVRASAPSNTLTVDVMSGPPVIEKVDSFVGSDVDAHYASGSLVRINVLELYRAENIVSGTVRITSASTGYDSGAEALSFDPAAESWFYHWVTNDLAAADDYTILATLTNDTGLSDSDGSDAAPDHTVSLTAEPPLVTTLFQVDEFSVPARGLDVTFTRTYQASSLFEGVMGRGWHHSYEIFLELNDDGSRVVVDGARGEFFYMPDGVGGYTATKPNNHAELFAEVGGYRMRFPDGLTYRFNGEGKLLTITDRVGNTLTFSYNVNGLLGAITDASGQATTFGYTLFSGGAWRLTDVTDPFGRPWFFVYHPDHSLFAVEDPLGQAENYFYHPTGELSLRVDRSGVQTFYNYFNDEKRRLASRNIPGDIDRVDYVYGPGAEIQLTDGLGRVTKREFSASGLLTKETDPLGGVTRYEYDSDWNLTKVTDALGKESSFTYDGKGNLLTSTDPLARVTQFTYDPVFNQILTSIDPAGRVSEFRYDASGNLTESEDALGNVTAFEYDGFGNLTKTRDALGEESIITYTAQGLVVSSTDALGRRNEFFYDARGNLIEEKDPAGKSTFFSYDALNRVTSTTDRNGAVTQFTYTPTGKIKTLIDHFGRTTSHIYDAAERLTTRFYPGTTREGFGYDKAGNITLTRDRSAVIIQYEYDALNRLTKKTFPDASMETYSYDALGRLISAANADTGALGFAYFDDGALMSVTTSQPTPKTLSFEYDAAGNRSTLLDYAGRLTTYRYDGANRLDEIETTDGVYDYGYDAASRLSEKAFPNGLTSRYSYDAAGQLLSLSTKKASNQTVESFGYSYDTLGNIRDKAMSVGMAHYDYDPLEQIVREEDPLAGVTPITYDALGNRAAAGGVPYTRNFLNQYTQAGTISFTYDGAGRMKTRNVPGEGLTTYTYDFHGRLKDVAKPDGSAVHFTYDPLGRRHSKTVSTPSAVMASDAEPTRGRSLKSQRKLRSFLSSHTAPVIARSAEGATKQSLPTSVASISTTYFLYDGDQVYAELDPSGNELRRYTWGPAIDELLAESEGSVTYSVLSDHQFSVTALTDESGNVVQEYTYDAFGNATDGITNRLTSFSYTGQTFDPETGLYYYRNRYLDPTLGRFISPDPLLFVDGVNLYTYVGNSCPNARDPYGLSTNDNEPCGSGPGVGGAGSEEFFAPNNVLLTAGRAASAFGYSGIGLGLSTAGRVASPNGSGALVFGALGGRAGFALGARAGAAFGPYGAIAGAVAGGTIGAMGGGALGARFDGPHAGKAC